MRRAQKGIDARWTQKHARGQVGARNHVDVDRRHKPVRCYQMSPRRDRPDLQPCRARSASCARDTSQSGPLGKTLIMGKPPRNSPCRLVYPALVILLAVPEAVAEEPARDEWEFDAEIYLWGASLATETTAGDEIDVGFDDIWKNLNFGAMGALAGHKNKWTLLADVIYLNLEGDDKTTANIVDVPLEVTAKLNLQGVISMAGVGYTVFETDGTTINALGGLRFLWLDGDLEFDIGPEQAKAFESGTNVDGIIGVRGRTDLAEKWFVTYYADVGTGQTSPGRPSGRSTTASKRSIW